MKLHLWAAGSLAAAWVSLLTVADAQQTNCIDIPNWHDNYNYRCEHYDQGNFCTSNGSLGRGWEEEWGAIADWKVDGGMDATKACCVCGGGKRTQPKERKRRELMKDAPKKGTRKPDRRPDRKPGPNMKKGDRMSNRDWKNKLGSTDGL